MATARLLAELIRLFESISARSTTLESVGGVDAAKRVRNGEAFDLVILASDVIDTLIAEGHIVDGTRVDLVRSPIAVAVRSGMSHPDISSADNVRSAVVSAGRVCYSTGPSGTHIAKLLTRWGLDRGQTTITVAPPGVPVGLLVARGDIALGFQQLSEFIGVQGIDVIGMLPDDIQSVTTFSGGVARTTRQPEHARELLEYMAGAAVAGVKRTHGMEPA